MLRIFKVIVISVVMSMPVCATTVLKVGMNELAQNAEFIFEGRVLSRQVRVSKASPRPCTYFTFQIMDVVKGQYDKPQIELCFAGGTINGITMKVSGMLMPGVGETGIYFVDALANEPVHPLLGWSQGHYLVETDSADIQRVVPAFPETIDADDSDQRALKFELAPDIDAFKDMIRDQM